MSRVRIHSPRGHSPIPRTGSMPHSARSSPLDRASSPVTGATGGSTPEEGTGSSNHLRTSRKRDSNVAGERHAGSPPPASAMPERDYLERDVEGNYLATSHFYRGFYYMLRHQDIAVCEEMREKLFPTLAVALESVLHKVIGEQLEREARIAAQRGTVPPPTSPLLGPGSGTTGKASFRQKASYPSQPLKSTMNPVQLLARELKAFNKKAKAQAALQDTIGTDNVTSAPLDVDGDSIEVAVKVVPPVLTAGIGSSRHSDEDEEDDEPTTSPPPMRHRNTIASSKGSS